MKSKKKKKNFRSGSMEIAQEPSSSPLSNEEITHAPIHFQGDTSIDQKNQKSK